ncbi:MAG: murB [Candidatus Saccharibacteria bacterium]|nr:murB [Candidatus Saccharibacteria bacterium]
MNVQTNIPLSTLTTMKIGGNANYVVDVTTREELRQAYQNAKKLGQQVYIIGSGSNTIAHDEGFNGVIVHNKIPGIKAIVDDHESTTLQAGGGEIWDDLVKYSVDLNLSGIEAMSGIPGTVGAAPVQNIGAYGQELANTFISLDAYDTQTDAFVTLSWEDCSFSYRHSIFRGNAQGRYAITTITLKLYKKLPEPPFYESLQKRFDELHITAFTPQTIRENVLAIRADKLPDPTKWPNAGSFFKNAIVESWQVESIRQSNSDVLAFDQGNGKFKIPAGWLIEASDLKGEVLHGMKVHDKNAVVLINESATSYADLAAAREQIITTVRDNFQIVLEQEPLELDQPVS